MSTLRPDAEMSLVGPEIIGVIHLPPLPGTPFHREGSVADIAASVAIQVAALAAGGANGVLLQTSDRVHPPNDDAEPGRVAAMTLITRAAVESASPGFKVGVQIMRNAVSASLAVAKVAGAHFIRASALVGVTSSTQGWVIPDSEALMQLRSRLDAWDIKVFADVLSVHYSWYGSEVEVDQVARRAILAGADAVCIGLPDTEATRLNLERMKDIAPEIDVVLAGHCTADNASILLPLVRRAFVSRLLTGGGWHDPITQERVRGVLDRLRNSRD